MRGMWPIEVKDHGIRCATGRGGVVIGLTEFGIRRRGKCDDAGNDNQTRIMSGLLKFKGNQEDRMIW